MNIPFPIIRNAVRHAPSSIEETLEYVRAVYADSTDKRGVPSWRHPYEVMLGLPESVSDDVRRAALLHDVVEDTRESARPVTRQDLEALGHSARTCDIVEKLTFESPRAKTYVQRIRDLIADGDLDALRIKLSDVRINRSFHRNASLPSDWQESRGVKYDEPLALLGEAVARLTPPEQKRGR